MNFGCCLYRAAFDCPPRRQKDGSVKNVGIVLSSPKMSPDNGTFEENPACWRSLHPNVSSTEQDCANIELREKHKRVRLETGPPEVESNMSVTIYLVRFLAVSDICFILTELILVWLLRPTDTKRLVFSKVKFTFECRLETMLSKLFCITSEWTLVIFGLERALITVRPQDLWCCRVRNCRASRWPKTLPSLDKLKLKVGMGLFIALLFATMCNYLWMTGETKIHMGRHQNDIVPMPTLVCIVRSEFYNFYYKFMVYLEELAIFVLPHLCTTVCLLIITIQYGIQLLPQWCVCVHHITQTSNVVINDRWPTSNDTSSLEQPTVNTDMTVLLFNLIFCLDALFRIVLSTPENWKRFIFLFSKLDTSKQTFNISQELNFSKFTVSSSITVIFLCWHFCRVPKRTSDVVIV